MGEPKMTAEELLGPPAPGDVVIDSSYHMGLLEQMGGLLRYERFGPLHDRPRVLADASTCQVYVGRRRALRVIERMQARIVELEAERDEARERAICAASSEARRIDERDIAYAALTSAAKALAANDFDLAREVLCRSSARDKAAELRRADMKHTLAAAARAEKAEARVAELEAQKNGAYSERNKLVAALSKVFPAALSRHPDEDTTWDNDWRWIVFVDLPTGQASWHIHDSEKPLFDHLRHEQRVWDGHTTDQKYARLAALGKEAQP